MGSILNKERKKELEKLRKKAIEALKELTREAHNREIGEWFEQTLYNVENISIGFFPRKVMSAQLAKVGNLLVGSVVKGQQVTSIRVIQSGKNTIVRRQRWIEMPADLVFEGNKISLDGIMTLMHEYSHFPRHAENFALAVGLSAKKAEELIADLISAKVAKKMGISREEIEAIGLERIGYYGGFPFKELFERAIR